jgi:hypothetical protein
MHQLFNGVTQLAGRVNASLAAILQEMFFELEYVNVLLMIAMPEKLTM